MKMQIIFVPNILYCKWVLNLCMILIVFYSVTKLIIVGVLVKFITPEFLILILTIDSLKLILMYR